jgi:hypothetical protein
MRPQPAARYRVNATVGVERPSAAVLEGDERGLTGESTVADRSRRP